tara:strand:+ start:40 stop:837 length:798 start_codon:yes stop_codon:yes gene_type:complete
MTSQELQTYFTTAKSWVQKQRSELKGAALKEHKQQLLAQYLGQAGVVGDFLPLYRECLNQWEGDQYPNPEEFRIKPHQFKRILPLTEKDKKIVQANGSRLGDTVALRLRNSAIVALLLEPFPVGVRVSGLRWLEFNDLRRDDNHGGYEKFSTWPVVEITPDQTITAINVNTRLGKRQVTLSKNASDHLSRWVMYPDGWQAVKPYWAEYLFLPIGLGGSMSGKVIEPISRQLIWRIAKQAGDDAEIKGIINPNLMRKESPKGSSDE